MLQQIKSIRLLNRKTDKEPKQALTKEDMQTVKKHAEMFGFFNHQGNTN